MKTLLVTGGSGFIGRNVVERFLDTYSVLSPSHKELDLLSQKAVREFVNEYTPDHIIHCANIGGSRKCPSTPATMEQNLRMFSNLTESSGDVDKFLYFGSGAEYGKSQNLVKVSEFQIGECIPDDYYGFSKYLMSKDYDKFNNITCLRLFGAFGKYEDYEYKFISNAIVKNLLGLPIRIRQNVFFDWLYIDDLLEIVSHFLVTTAHFTDYNITPDSSTDLVSVSTIINECSEIPSEIIIETPGLNYEYSGSNMRLRQSIGRFAFTPMETAIKHLFQYYRGILPNIDPRTIYNDIYAIRCNTRGRP